MAADAIALGASPEQAAALAGPPVPTDCEVFEENWDAVLLFLELQTQWLIGPMGGYIGMNYPGIESAMRMMRVKDRPTLFKHLRTMEHAALEAIRADQ